MDPIGRVDEKSLLVICIPTKENELNEKLTFIYDNLKRNNEKVIMLAAIVAALASCLWLITTQMRPNE